MTSRLKIVLLGILVAVVATGAGLWYSQQEHDPSPKVFYNLAATHLKAFQKEDFSSAYAMASANLRRVVTEAQFQSLMQQYGLATLDYQTLEFGASSRNGDHAELDVRGVNGQNGRLFFRYYFVREKGKWKVESFQLCSEPKPARRQSIKSI